MLTTLLACPNSTLGTLQGEMSLKSMVRLSASLFHSGQVVLTFTKEVLHGFHFSTSLTVWIQSHSGFERLFVCPDGAVKDLECCFLGFRSKRRQLKDTVSVVKVRLAQADGEAVSNSGVVRWGHSNFVTLNYLQVECYSKYAYFHCKLRLKLGDMNLICTVGRINLQNASYTHSTNRKPMKLTIIKSPNIINLLVSHP